MYAISTPYALQKTWLQENLIIVLRADLSLVPQYLYIRHNNLYLLALTKRNTNAAEILLFLHKIVEVFTEYFKELEEESIRDNFVVIYELLDEMMDFGYPQTTESKILQEYDSFFDLVDG